MKAAEIMMKELLSSSEVKIFYINDIRRIKAEMQA